MKRLLAAGAEAIYQITRAFRAGECGALHNPEFTIVEWYRAGDDYEQGMQLLGELTSAMLGRGDAERLSYASAFEQFAGVNPLHADLAEIRQVAERRAVTFPNMDSADRDDWLDLLLVQLVQPYLGVDRPEILYDYPASQAALARVRDETPPVAERFELYVDGIELANGYHELLDAEELRLRNTEANRKRVSDGKQTLPEECRLIAAMQHGLPACTGVALGFDRLAMIAARESEISKVIAFPLDRA